MGAIDDLAAATNQVPGPAAAVSMRLMAVTAYNVGSPDNVDLALTQGGDTVIFGARLSTSYQINVPQVNDVVVVLVTQPNGSSRNRGRNRGGFAFVVDRVAT